MAPAPGGMNRFYVLLAGGAVVGAGALGFLALRRPPVSIPANVTVQAADTSGFRGYLAGSADAPLEVTEYADYECPACQEFTVVQMPTIEERLIATGKVRWRYRDFPLDRVHRFPRIAAHAAACADEEGKFWEMNRHIYSWEPRWPEQRNAIGTFRDYAKAIGLDLPKYDACMGAARYAGRIQASLDEGMAAGVASTPSFLIRGRVYAGGRSVSYDMLKAMLDSIPARPAQ